MYEDMCQTNDIPEVKETIVMLRQLSADEKVRQEAYYREKRLHDEATALGTARREGIAEGRAEGRAEGIAEGEAKGKAEGMLNTLEKLVKKGIITISQAAEQANMPEEEFKEKAGLTT